MTTTILEMDYTKLSLADREQSSDGESEQAVYEMEDKEEESKERTSVLERGRKLVWAIKDHFSGETVQQIKVKLESSKWQGVCWLLAIAVICVLPVVIMECYSLSQRNSMAAKHEKDTDALKLEQANLTETVATMQVRLQELKKYKQHTTKLSAEVTSLTKSVAELKNDVTANFSDLSAQSERMRTELNSLSDSMNKLNSGLQTLREETHANISRVSTSSSHSLKQLRNQVATNVSLLNKALESMKLSASKVKEDFKGKVAKVTGRVSQLEGNDASRAKSISDHGNRIKEAESKLQSLGQLKNDHESRLQQVEQGQASLKNKNYQQDQATSRLQFVLNNHLTSSGYPLYTNFMTLWVSCMICLLSFVHC